METVELKKVLCTLLCDAYKAEENIIAKANDMTNAAKNGEIASIFKAHELTAKNQLNRLERAFEITDLKRKDVDSPIVEAICGEGKVLVEGAKEGPVRDAALIIALQRKIHNEIATYGSAVALADACGYPEAAALLKETLDEEYTLDKKLTEIATSYINTTADRQAA